MYWIILLLVVKCVDAAIQLEGEGQCPIGKYSTDFSATCHVCDTGFYMPYTGSIYPMSLRWSSEILKNTGITRHRFPVYESENWGADFCQSNDDCFWTWNFYKRDGTWKRSDTSMGWSAIFNKADSFQCCTGDYYNRPVHGVDVQCAQMGCPVAGREQQKQPVLRGFQMLIR